MKKHCELCGNRLIRKYGSGRFCNSFCSHAFTTKAKRKIINEKVSKTLLGRPNWNNAGFKKGFDPRRYKLPPADIQKAVEARKIKRAQFYRTAPFKDLPFTEKRRVILREQNYACLCGLKKWYSVPLILELHHVDGNKENDERGNLEMRCPNCHSITPNFKNKKRILA